MKKILEFLKAKEVIIIILLCLLSMFSGVKSCSSGRSAKKAQKELVLKTQEFDSLMSVKDDSIRNLNKRIEILVTETKGLEKTLQIQGEAINQITEAKKNINVVVKQKK